MDKKNLKTDLWSLFADQDLDCPGPLDVMVPRLRPVSVPPLEESVSFHLVLFVCRAAGMDRDSPKGGFWSTDSVFSTDASTASPAG